MKRTDFSHATRIEWQHNGNIRQIFTRADGQFDFLEFTNGELDTIRTGDLAAMRALGLDVARAAELAALPADEYPTALTDEELTERLAEVDEDLNGLAEEISATVVAADDCRRAADEDWFDQDDPEAEADLRRLAEEYEDDICHLAIDVDQLAAEWLPLNAERARRRAAA